MIRRQSTMIRRILLFVSFLGQPSPLNYSRKLSHLGKQLGSAVFSLIWKTAGNTLNMEDIWEFRHEKQLERTFLRENISIYMIPTGVPEICGNAVFAKEPQGQGQFQADTPPGSTSGVAGTPDSTLVFDAHSRMMIHGSSTTGSAPLPHQSRPLSSQHGHSSMHGMAAE